MKYLVTGGAGFIGSHVCEALLEDGHDVICVDNFNDYYSPERKEANIRAAMRNDAYVLYRADVRDHDALKEIFDREDPDIVIHLAARAGVRPSLEQPRLYADVNVQGTANLLELSANHTVKRFIFASSSSVYGERKEVPFRESDRVDNPISPYAATKKAGELLCASYSHHGLPCICLRFFTVYGPRGRPDMAAYKFIDAVMDGREITMYGDGSSMRDYTFIDDIVRGILAACMLQETYAIINLGNNNPVTLREFISLIEEAVGKEAETTRLPTQPGDVSRTYADVQKAKEMLGWEPAVPLGEGLKRTAEWMANR